MAKSQNGWTASSNKSAIGIVNPKVPGTNVDFPNGVRGGDVETVLMYVAEQFHKTVEPLKDGWCWGYAYRTIDGSSDLSNHASGTAIDLNAPKHPMGVKGTFTAKQVAAIEKILDYLEGVVRWGGHYKGRVDEMHFEIVGSAAQVARIADKIKKGSAPAPKPKPAQPKLVEDGYLGPKTITRWQQIMGTPVDGKISEPKSALVKAVQKHLNAKINAGLVVDGYGIKQDGRFYHTIKALQKYVGTPQTGRLTKGAPSTCIKALQKRLNTGKF